MLAHDMLTGPPPEDIRDCAAELAAAVGLLVEQLRASGVAVPPEADAALSVLVLAASLR